MKFILEIKAAILSTPAARGWKPEKQEYGRDMRELRKDFEGAEGRVPLPRVRMPRLRRRADSTFQADGQERSS